MILRTPRLLFALTTLTACLGFSVTAPASLDITVNRFTIGFFTNQVPIDYAEEMLIAEPRKLDNSTLDRAYRQLKRAPVDVLLNSLLQSKKKYQLNDFLFFKLADNALESIYRGGSPNAREITLFTLLTRAGYDTRLTFRENRAYINVYTQDEIFEVPMIDHDGRTYANISCLNGECRGRQSLYIYREHPNPRGKSFGFRMDQWPNLSPKPISRPLSFRFRGLQTEMKVEFDQTMVDIMAEYPFVNEYCYLETPLSPTLRESLLPQLSRLLGQLSLQEQLELLVSFTRSAFEYKEDNEYFGHSKPMVPEELFSYAYSDCEDRSALFYALVRELIDIPMAVIAYDDHLTVAVASDEISGDSFEAKGRRYVFCDPTGPRGSSRIGEIPPGYENKSFDVIGWYK